MKAKFFLFLEDEIEPGFTAYLADLLGVKEISRTDGAFALPDALKRSNEPVVVVTQKTLAEELEEMGSLNQVIKENRKAGIIILPESVFATVSTANDTKSVSLKHKGVEGQFRKSVELIMDETTPRHSIFMIAES